MINFLYNLFLRIPTLNSLGIFGKIIHKIISIIFNKIINSVVKNEYQKNDVNLSQRKNNNNHELIISLTSFPARLDNLWITIESLFRQSVAPDKIILWLVTEEIQGVTLPNSLIDLLDNGLEIHYANDNLRPHNKYYHTIKKFPNAVVVTVDDDIIYPINMLENLLKMHLEFPEAVCANLTSMISIKNSSILPYRKWKEFFKDDLTPNNKMIQLGVSGVLYPPNTLPDVCFDKDLIQKLAPTADDIWLNLMCFLNGKKIVTNNTFKKYFVTVNFSQNITLHSLNTTSGKNDEIFKNVTEFFKIKLIDNSVMKKCAEY